MGGAYDIVNHISVRLVKSWCFIHIKVSLFKILENIFIGVKVAKKKIFLCLSVRHAVFMVNEHFPNRYHYRCKKLALIVASFFAFNGVISKMFINQFSKRQFVVLLVPFYIYD